MFNVFDPQNITTTLHLGHQYVQRAEYASKTPKIMQNKLGDREHLNSEVHVHAQQTAHKQHIESALAAQETRTYRCPLRCPLH